MHRGAILRGVAPLIIFAAAPARANDVAAAALLFDQGVEHMKARDYETGCKEIAESVRLDRRPGALYTLARCEADWGRTATAWARFDEYLRFCEKLSAVEKAKQTSRIADATQRRDQLARDVPYLTLTLSAKAPQSTVIMRNGETFSAALLGKRLPVDPGVYEFSTQVPQGPVTKRRLEILKGSNETVVLDVALPRPPAVVKPSSQPKAGWVIAGIGGALSGAGLIAGATVLPKKDIVDGNCGATIGHPQSPTTCNKMGLEALEAANTRATLANIGVIGGVVVAAGGLILVAIAPKPSPPPKTGFMQDVTIELGPTQLGGIMGSFRSSW